MLISSGVGCYIGNKFAGAVSYADDITLIAPTVQAIQTLLTVCGNFSQMYEVLFNENKSVCIKFHKDRNNLMPDVNLNHVLLK